MDIRRVAPYNGNEASGRGVMNSMKHRLVLLGLLAVAGLPVADALAFCTTRERIQLRNEGVPQAEIDRLCGGTTQQRVPSMSPQQQMPRPRFATLCMTNAGPCPMAVAMPVGSACACYTPWGAVPGVAQ